MNPSRSQNPFPAWPGHGGRVFARLVELILLVVGLSAGIARAQMALYPANSTIETGSSRQFTAYVPLSPNTVTWTVNGVPGGNAVYGTIGTGGLYRAPATAPTNNVVTVRIQSTAYPAQSTSTSITVTRPYPWLWSTYPSALQTGSYQVSFNGANFAPDSQALANGVPVATTYSSPTKLVVKGTVASAGNLEFSVRQPGPGSVTGNTVSVAVTVPTIAIAVSPASAGVALGASRSFAATVSGTANTAVLWSVNGVAGGNATLGTVSSSGTYTAPAAMPASPSVTLVAAAAANPAVTASAAVTLTLPPVTVAVSPASASVTLATSQAFSATVSGTANTAVLWSVNGVADGNATLGTVSSSGTYTAPAAMPASATVAIAATSVAVPSVSGQATATLVPPPIAVAVVPASATVRLGQFQAFAAAVSGTANTAVSWSVNGIAGGNATVGTIDAFGNYTAPAAMPSPTTVAVRATSAASAAATGQAVVALAPAPFPQVWLAGARFLDQSSFGPNPASLARVQQLGIQAYLDEQFSLPENPIPVPSDNSMGPLRNWMLYHYSSAPDQLRQRVAYALSQIIVTSGNKLVYADEVLPWLRLLDQHAFGNYRTLLREVAVSPSMGKYLDLANSLKPGLAGGANENFAREVMQLFTIGIWRLNPDGTQQLDAGGNPIPTYDQTTVQQAALALTGWTYATAPGATPRAVNWEYFGAPMEPRPANHDASAKSVLGQSIPAGQTVDQDLDSLLDILVRHPNAAPFVSVRLIRALVTSNPTPGYVRRVATVFSDNGNGVRGDLHAVVQAILLDPEARDDAPPPDFGRVKEPILQTCGLLRALNGQFTAGQQVTYLYDYMAQSILTPPSVFGWYSPLYHVPRSPLFGPEFQIYSPTEAALRGNFLFSAINYPASDMVVDLSPFQPYGNDMPGLVEAANQVLLHGRMPAAMKTALIAAATPGYDARTRIETVLYLTGLSGQYAVQY